MKYLLIVLLFVLPFQAAINDPGAGLELRSDRRAARVTTWQAAYESLSAEQRQNQARKAIEDMWNPTCLYEQARQKGADGTDADVQEWIEDHVSVLDGHRQIDLLNSACSSPTDWIPEPDNQGGILARKIIVGTANAIRDIKREVPMLPRIGNVPPLLWAGGPLQTCTINAVEGPCVAMSNDLHEVHRDILEAIALAKGLETSFTLVNNLDEVGWTVAE